MTKQTPSSLLLVGAIAGGVGFVAFVALMVVGDFSVSPAAFLAIVVMLAAAVALFLGFHREGEATDRAARAPVAADYRFVDRTVAPGTADVATGTAADSQIRGERLSAESAPAEPPVAPDEGGFGAAPAKIRTGTLLKGQQELAERKGSWTYERRATTGAPGTGGAEELSVEPGSVEPASAEPEVRAADSTIGVEPPRLSEAREGGPDDLKRIKGIGPKLEELLHRLGVFHYDQVATWSDKEAVWVDENLEGFRGRVSRDDWVEQARRLAVGDETKCSPRGNEDEAAS